MMMGLIAKATLQSEKTAGRGPLHENLLEVNEISDTEDDDVQSYGSLSSPTMSDDEAFVDNGDDCDNGGSVRLKQVSLDESEGPPELAADLSPSSGNSIASMISNQTVDSSDPQSQQQTKEHLRSVRIITPNPFSCQRRVQSQRRRQPLTLATTEQEVGNRSSTAYRDEPVIVLGADISHLSPLLQFLVCAGGVFAFNLSFGYLQEFVAVVICSRNLGLFLSMMQFTGYTALSYAMRTFVRRQQENEAKGKVSSASPLHSHPKVPPHLYLSLGLLSAVDMAMTNMAMHYVNYPAKTLMKSSRVVFTMLFGVLIAGKRYRLADYLVVLGMVAGLAIFMQADASSSAIFEPLGVVMLIISLLCDGAINVISETVMKSYGVGQDELIFRMYSVALIAVTAAATYEGDLQVGMIWLLRPGTYDEWHTGASDEEITWDVLGKIAMIILFSSMGFFGSSCSAAITKNFGALTMSMTSTARRAATLFISFLLFDNECTYDHVVGIVFFIAALTTKSCMSRTDSVKNKQPISRPIKDLEMQTELANARALPHKRSQSK